MEKNIVIVGATSSIAHHCARLWMAEKSTKSVILIGRDQEKLEMVSADLSVRNSNVKIQILSGDLINLESINKLITQSCHETIPNIVLIAHGSLAVQTECEKSLLVTNDALQINSISPVLFVEGFVAQMAPKGSGVIAVIGSVAGDRGRKSNYVYGAAKGMVDKYVQGLQHRLAKTKLSAILIKPGPTDTPMTSEMKAKGLKVASVTKVADDIVKGIQQRKPVIYTPGKWRLIMLVIIHFPRFIFNKLDI